jgi:catechol 2,3-dioxygenase-like lactoylglutathione lyase family enzyme
MAILGFHHVGISTCNLERSVAFYCELFDFEKVFEFEWQPGVALFDRMMRLRETAARVAMLRAGTSFLEVFEFVSPRPAAVSFSTERLTCRREPLSQPEPITS